MTQQNRERIIDLVKEIAIINRILVRDEKTMSLERWQELHARENEAHTTIANLLEE